MERLRDNGLQADVHSYTAILETCLAAGNTCRGAYWHQRMLEQGLDCHISLLNQLAHAMSASACRTPHIFHFIFHIYIYTHVC